MKILSIIVALSEGQPKQLAAPILIVVSLQSLLSISVGYFSIWHNVSGAVLASYRSRKSDE